MFTNDLLCFANWSAILVDALDITISFLKPEFIKSSDNVYDGKNA